MEIITLDSPITKGESTLTELKIADAKVHHMTATDGFGDKEGYAADLALLAALTGKPEAILGEIGPEDWAGKIRPALALVYGRFMGISPKELKEALEESPPDQAGEKASAESSKNESPKS